MDVHIINTGDISVKYEKICKNCAYFQQHYTLDKECCMPVYCGHCTHGRVKKRKPDQMACEHYEYRDNNADLPDRQGVVHFLTTEFLKRVLEKALPPEIQTDEGFE